MQYVAEIYEGEAPYAEGTPLWELPFGWLPEHVARWAEEHGHSPENPGVWVNIVPVGTWAPNNNPVAQMVFEHEPLEQE